MFLILKTRFFGPTFYGSPHGPDFGQGRSLNHGILVWSVWISVRITKNIINIRTGFNIVKNWSNSLMFRKTGPIRNTVVIFEFSFLKPSTVDSGRSLGVKADDP